MATVEKLLDDIKLRYRHSYKNEQVLAWFSEEQRELFEVFGLESPPVSFMTIADVNFYPIPAEVDVSKIRAMTIQMNDDSINPNYQEVPFKRNDSGQSADGIWFTVVGDSLFISIPGGLKDDRAVYLFVDQAVSDVTTNDLSIEPATPVKFQEILKLGTLKRVAYARKDVVMGNNFSMERESKIEDMLWKMKISEPEFITPTDVLPRRIGYGRTVAITLSSESN